MSNSDQLKALVESHYARDEERFHTLALQLAAAEVRSGHAKLASELKAMVDRAKLEASRAPAARPVPITTPRGELAGLLSVSYPATRLSDLVLRAETTDRLERVVREQRARDKLAGMGLSPRRKLLLTGPPGSGKTMTASALAGELNLPLYVVVLDVLITRFMGETAAKLRLVFDALASQRGVYLFDELEAIGTERGAKNDVGEMGRVVSSFLQFLEQDRSDSLIVAATNHPMTLDHALYRRFDDIIPYQLPDDEQARQVIEAVLAAFDLKRLSWPRVLAATSTLSHAEITRACEDAAKDAVLDDSKVIASDKLVRALEARHRVPSKTSLASTRRTSTKARR